MNRLHRWLCASALWNAALERSLVPWALEGVDLGDHVLEVGPGPGLTTALLRRRAPHVTAVEIDSRLAASLRRRTAGTNVRVVRGDGASLPFPAGCFSAAVSLTMLHHVPSAALQDRLLAEVYRTLRPAGAFAGIDNTVNPGFRLLHLGDTLVSVDPVTFGARLQAVGFADVEISRRRGQFRFRAVRPA